MLGGIQPGPIQKIAREAEDDGLLQRFMFCVPARQGSGVDRKPDRDALDRYERLFPALTGLHPPSSPFAALATAAPSAPRAVVLHQDAHQHRFAMNELAAAMARMPDASARLVAAFGKWPGLFARLALAFHLIEIADARANDRTVPPLTVLPETTARRAAAFMREVLLPHLLRAEAIMFMTVQTSHTRWVARYVLAHGKTRVAVRDIMQAYGALRAPENRRELLEVMESLVSVGWLKAEEPDSPTRQPRQPTAWQVNPKVHTLFAKRAEHEREARRAARQETAERLRRHAMR